MYCSRRGITVTKPSDTCRLCARCNWETQKQDFDKTGKSGFVLGVFIVGAVLLIAAVLIFL